MNNPPSLPRQPSPAPPLPRLSLPPHHPPTASHRFDARTGKVITTPSKSSLSYQKSLSSSTTRSFRKGISRTATSIDDVRVEIHKIFPTIALVGQAIIALGCFMAFLVYWLHKKNVDDGLDVER